MEAFVGDVKGIPSAVLEPLSRPDWTRLDVNKSAETRMISFAGRLRGPSPGSIPDKDCLS
jgi:hypothetical protein